MKYGTFIDLGKNSLKNATIDPRDDAPGLAENCPIGMIWTDVDGGNSKLMVNLATGGINAWTQLASGTTAMFNPMTTYGDMIYGGLDGTATRLAGNGSLGVRFLRQTGLGHAVDTTSWETLAATDIPNIDFAKITTGVVPVAQGGTAQSVWTANGIVFADTTTSFSQITDVTNSGRALVSVASGAPVFGKVVLTQPTTLATITFTTDSTTLTVADNASVSGTNTGDVTLATDSGLGFALGQTGLALGLPSTISDTSSNSVGGLTTHDTHTHAISNIVVTTGGSTITAGTTTIGTGTLTSPVTTLAIAANAAFTVADGATFTSANIAVNPTDVPNKAYVDSIAVGISTWKQAARVATLGILDSHTESAPGVLTCSTSVVLVVDGITPVLHDRILVKDEGLTDGGGPTQNGIYTVTQLGVLGSAPWKLTRSTDADESAEVTTGMYVYVSEGSAGNAGQYVLTTAAPITLESTPLTFVKFSGAHGLTAGTGITIAGDTICITNTGVTGYGTPVGSATTVPIITYNAQGQLTTVSSTTITGVSPVGSALVDGKIWVGNSSDIAAAVAVSGDITLANTGAVTVTKLNGTSLAGLATGLLYNTTSTGVPSIATSSQILAAIGGTPVNKFSGTITGVTSRVIYIVTHNLHTKDVTVAFYDEHNATYMVDYVTPDDDYITVTYGYGAPPPGAAHRCVVMG